MTSRHWFLGAIAILAAAPTFGQGFDGVLTVSHGYYIDPEGRKISLVGKKVPFHGEPIQLNVIGPRAVNQETDGAEIVYRNDHGDLSYIVAPIPMPSALDDVLMVNAAGARWQTLMMGVNCNISDPNDDFLIRWIGFRTFTPGLGAGVSAFSNVVMDFGGRMNIFLADPFAEVPGAFKLTFNIGGFNISSPTNQIYFAQQFRVWSGGNPNAPFRDEFDSVFSIGFPNPGTSQETFYWDFEPNGIYDETEVDIWPQGSEANMLLGITAMQTGTVDTRLPSSFTVQPGTIVSGALGDLWDDDGFELVCGPGVVLISNQAPLRMTLTSTSLSTSPTRVAMLIEGRSTSTAIQQQVEFWNYQSNQWVLADTRSTTTNSTVIEVEAPGVPTQYVHQATRQVQTRLSYRATGPILVYPWRMRWDQAVWKITRP
jgi:hypothetical protein